MSNLDLLALLEQEANEICSGFELARLEGKGTPQEVADRNEFVIQSFFKKYYPIPYWVTKGNIVDSYNNRSCSVDCVILNPSHPHTFVREVNKPSIIFADGVDFAIEIKPDLRNKNLYEGLKQISTVKKLKRKRTGIVNINKIPTDKRNYYYQIPSIIFAEKTYKNKKTLIKNISEFYDNNKIPFEQYFDMIIINNDCVILNDYMLSDIKSLSIFDTQEKTLALLLLLLNLYPPSEPRILAPILNQYITIDDFEDLIIEAYKYDETN